MAGIAVALVASRLRAAALDCYALKAWSRKVTSWMGDGALMAWPGLANRGAFGAHKQLLNRFLACLAWRHFACLAWPVVMRFDARLGLFASRLCRGVMVVLASLFGYSVEGFSWGLRLRYSAEAARVKWHVASPASAWLGIGFDVPQGAGRERG